MGFRTALIVAVLSIVAIRLGGRHQFHVPLADPSVPHQNGFRVLEEIWTDDEAARLRAMVEGQTNYFTTLEDVSTSNDNIGEAIPLPPTGCGHPYLVPNVDRTHCILPQRIDVGRHFLLHGGVNGLKEPYEQLVSRMLSFHKLFHAFHGTLDKVPEIKVLFDSVAYNKAAVEMCNGKSVFDPIQLGIILQIPGQTVPMHLDVPWFYGAHRASHPQWLLVVMEQSGLFADLRVQQIQGVAYLHRWNQSEFNGGGFFFYPDGKDGPPVIFPAKWKSAIIMDGSVVTHGSSGFQPSIKTIPLSKDVRNELRHVGDGRWSVLGGAGETLANLTTDDFRISLVWRSRCFNTEEEKATWQKKADFLSVEDVLSRLVDDLRARGRLGPNEPRPEPIELALLLIDEYTRMPKGPNLIPYNYCMAQKLMPQSLKFLLAPLCS